MRVKDLEQKTNKQGGASTGSIPTGKPIPAEGLQRKVTFVERGRFPHSGPGLPV